ncbi:hypothetical protein [Methylobacterium sp. J-068]|uniref:hypothetical protein n=1 Tax=Methylobacterium sp. J-068 TaxID=2836649 RepID=UPI001FB98425|nr:hypothetical protein [Methylobacterium sp. J-068]MCJ2034705.1 hypothetical protein [Methylobacterium sp. J-068]
MVVVDHRVAAWARVDKAEMRPLRSAASKIKVQDFRLRRMSIARRAGLIEENCPRGGL